ncbi:MAG: hypothetical protein HY551_05645 [Elusimicrobia bacterium]|nr:hypothetical protein [Elusimicrobiota bacterium]
MKTACILSVVMLLPASGLRAHQIQVFPPDFCSQLPRLTEDQRGLIDRIAPELKSLPAHLMDSQRLHVALEAAVAQRISSLDVFTEDAVREPCAVLIPRWMLKDLDDRFEMAGLLPLFGEDTSGIPFNAEAVVYGDGRFHLLYDRGSFKYRHPIYRETFKYASLVRVQTPVQSQMNIEGINGPYGLPILAIKKISASQVEVTAGSHRRKRPLYPISLRTPPEDLFAGFLKQAIPRAAIAGLLRRSAAMQHALLGW